MNVTGEMVRRARAHLDARQIHMDDSSVRALLEATLSHVPETVHAQVMAAMSEHLLATRAAYAKLQSRLDKVLREQKAKGPS